jgi:hypothetical protein
MFSSAIDAESRQILKKIGTIPLMSRFYLGGTACIASHIRHMKVSTLEFFTEADDFEQEPFVAQLIHAGNVIVRKQSSGSLFVDIDGSSVIFSAHPFPLIEPFKKISDVRVSGLLDCALATLIELSVRGSMQDFVNLFFVIKSGVDLRGLLRRIPEKYRTLSYSSYQLLRSLVWFDNAAKDVLPESKRKWDWPEVKAFFRKEVKSLMKDYFE